jgi:hypothetical protein
MESRWQWTWAPAPPVHPFNPHPKHPIPSQLTAESTQDTATAATVQSVPVGLPLALHRFRNMSAPPS